MWTPTRNICEKLNLHAFLQPSICTLAAVVFHVDHTRSCHLHQPIFYPVQVLVSFPLLAVFRDVNCHQSSPWWFCFLLALRRTSGRNQGGCHWRQDSSWWKIRHDCQPSDGARLGISVDVFHAIRLPRAPENRLEVCPQTCSWFW